MSTTTVHDVTPTDDPAAAGTAGARGNPLRALAGRDLGPVPVLLGLAAIWLVFQVLNDNFLTSRNLSNLVLQLGVVGMLSLGVVLVLLIGEIDLSLGTLAGVCAAVLGVLLTNEGWPTWATIALVVLVGAAAGTLQGGISVLVGVPSFVVTLGGFLAYQGVQLALLGDAGELRVEDPFVRGIANSYVPTWLAWVLAIGLAVGWTADVVARRRARAKLGLAVRGVAADAASCVAVAVTGVVVVAYLDDYFGVPWMLVLLVGVALALGWVTTRTQLGRHLFAIGGNAEAARRAGVRVDQVRVLVFAAAGALAGLAGIVAVSRQFSVSTGTGGGSLLLEAIAAAVIGGTSLFGGRGRVYQALLGALVIASVENGLDLLGKPSSFKDIATGVILVAAVSIDAISRRRRAALGI
jgi:D-xylose transport system permease protein